MHFEKIFDQSIHKTVVGLLDDVVTTVECDINQGIAKGDDQSIHKTVVRLLDDVVTMIECDINQGIAKGDDQNIHKTVVGLLNEVVTMIECDINQGIAKGDDQNIHKTVVGLLDDVVTMVECDINQGIEKRDGVKPAKVAPSVLHNYFGFPLANPPDGNIYFLASESNKLTLAELINIAFTPVQRPLMALQLQPKKKSDYPKWLNPFEDETSEAVTQDFIQLENNRLQKEKKKQAQNDDIKQTITELLQELVSKIEIEMKEQNQLKCELYPSRLNPFLVTFDKNTSRGFGPRRRGTKLPSSAVHIETALEAEVRKSQLEGDASTHRRASGLLGKTFSNVNSNLRKRSCRDDHLHLNQLQSSDMTSLSSWDCLMDISEDVRHPLLPHHGKRLKRKNGFLRRMRKKLTGWFWPCSRKAAVSQVIE